jgi:hypothetical protein
LIDEIVSRTWKKTYDDPYQAEINRTVDGLVLYYLMKLASGEKVSPIMRSVAYKKLDELKDWLEEQVESAGDEAYKALYLFGAELIDLYQENPSAVKLSEPLETPQGAPI